MADNQVLQDRWLLLTNSILRGLLPISYNKAAEAIMGRFLDASLDYHFSDFEISYSIGVDANGKATVLNTLKADLVISPNRPQAIFTQNIESDSPSKLLSLILDNTPIDLAQLVAAPTGADKTKLTLTLNLLEHIGNDKRSVRFERTFSTAQDIHSEPFISATISRFIKGAVIRTRISDGYKIRFLSNGIENAAFPVPDGEGYLRWVLAKPGNLLLPGQGYTLILVKI